MQIFYFGTYRHPGHHLFIPLGGHLSWVRNSDVPQSFHWTMKELDPEGPEYPWNGGGPAQTEGLAKISHKSGWTRLGWPDRSVDHRRGSHSNVMVDTEMSFVEILSVAREHLGMVVSRMRYDISLAG